MTTSYDRDEAKWAKFLAKTPRQRVIAFLFNPTAFPVMSNAARVQAFTIAVIVTAILFGSAELVKYLRGDYDKPAPAPPAKIMNGPL